MIAPVYVPARCPVGTWTSTHTARFSPFGTVNGNALRFSWNSGSTSGMSGSGNRQSPRHVPSALRWTTCASSASEAVRSRT